MSAPRYDLRMEQGFWRIYGAQQAGGISVAAMSAQLFDVSGRHDLYPDGCIRTREQVKAIAENLVNTLNAAQETAWQPLTPSILATMDTSQLYWLAIKNHQKSEFGYFERNVWRFIIPGFFRVLPSEVTHIMPFNSPKLP